MYLISKVLNNSQESWRAIVIDEFQDTSAMQYGLLRLLSSHKRITIVGDEDQVYFTVNQFNLEIHFYLQSDWSYFELLWFTYLHIIMQSIFGFNGADISGFDSFRKDFPMHKEDSQLISSLEFFHHIFSQFNFMWMTFCVVNEISSFGPG